MSRRGREPWSTRLLVEECLAFDIVRLVRAGVLRAEPGTLCSTEWKNPNEQVIFCAYLWVELTADGRRLLHVSSGVPSSRHLAHYAQSPPIEVVQTPLHFGPRPWFLCPGVYRNAPCRNRVRILYFPPGSSRLGCRRCLDLIHQSAREHDARLDALLRLPTGELREALREDALRLVLLGIRVRRVLQRRLEKKAAKLHMLAAK